MIFRLLYNHLEDRQENNVYEDFNQDDDYLKAPETEWEPCRKYESPVLSKEQKELINPWISTIHVEDATRSMPIFRMAI